jgi:hypothetical protein
VIEGGAGRQPRGGLVDEPAAVAPHQQLRLFARIGRGVGAVTDDQQIRSPVAVEIGDRRIARVHHRDIAEHGIRGVDKRPAIIAEGPEPRPDSGRSGWPSQLVDDEVKVAITVEVDRMGFVDRVERAVEHLGDAGSEVGTTVQDAGPAGKTGAVHRRERAPGAGEVAGGGNPLVIERPERHQPRAFSGQRLAGGGLELRGRAGDVPDTDLPREAGQAGVVDHAVGEERLADTERDRGLRRRRARCAPGSDQPAVLEQAHVPLFDHDRHVHPAAQGQRGRRFQLTVASRHAGGGGEEQMGSRPVQLQRVPDEGVDAGGLETLAQQPGVGGVRGEVKPALERVAGPEVEGRVRRGAERSLGEIRDIGLRGRHRLRGQQRGQPED